MHIDMVGYSHRIGRDDAGTMRRIRAFREQVVQPTLSRTGGLLRQTAGDSFLSVFDSIDGALQAALLIQHAARFRPHDEAAGGRMEFRIGIDVGDVIFDGSDVHGDGAIIAVRLQTAAGPGQICVSRAIRDKARPRADLRYEKLGALALKNVERPVEAFILHVEDPAGAAGLPGVWRRAERVLRSRRLAQRLKFYGAICLTAVLAADLAWISLHTGLGPGGQRFLPPASEAIDTSKLSAVQRQVIEDFARGHDVPGGVLAGIVSQLAATSMAQQPAELASQLAKKVEEYQAFLREASLLSDDDPKVAALRKDATRFANLGDFGNARANLLLAAQIDLGAAQALTDHARARALGAAQSLEESARIASVTLQFRDAARDLQDAASRVAPFDQRRQATLLAAACHQMSEENRYFGEADAGTQAAQLCRRGLDLARRGGEPAVVSELQQDLGDALTSASPTQMSEAPIEEAIAAYTAALDARRPETEPVLWAHTTTRLAEALESRSFFTGDIEPLREAAKLLTTVTQRLDQKQAPHEWADAEYTLGIALADLDDRFPDKNLTRASIRAYRAALAERVAENDAYEQAKLERVLINDLGSLGARETGRATLEAAVEEGRRALKIVPRERMPDLWASIQIHLADAMVFLSARDLGTARLHDAMPLLRAALDQRLTEQVTFPLADTRDGVGTALTTLGEREAEPARLDEAAQLFRAAMQTWTRDQYPQFWVVAQRGLGEALRVKAELTGDRALLAQARDALLAAQASATPGHNPQEDLQRATAIAHTEAALAPPRGPSPGLSRAISTLAAQLTPRWQEEFPVEWAQGQRALGQAYAAQPTPANLRAALAAFDAAQAIATRDTLPFDWAKTELARARVLGRGAAAKDAYRAALAVFAEGKSPFYAGLCEAGLRE